MYDVSEKIPIRIGMPEDFPIFSYKRRVSVSRLGLVAVIQQKHIVVFDVR